MIIGMHHTAISTRDIERLARFYDEAFGLKIIEDSGRQKSPDIDSIVGLAGSSARFMLLDAGNQILELFEFRTPQARPLDPDRHINDCGITHICFGVRDLDAEFARLSMVGMRFHAAPACAGDIPQRAVYGRDPDGNVVELLEINCASPFDYAPAAVRWRAAGKAETA